MSRRFQFSLRRLSAVVVLLCIALATFVAYDPTIGPPWLAITFTACGAAGGLMVTKNESRGAVLGAVIGLSAFVLAEPFFVVAREYSCRALNST
jgi:hypothetical protein